jgi:hypothetical protein
VYVPALPNLYTVAFWYGTLVELRIPPVEFLTTMLWVALTSALNQITRMPAAIVALDGRKVGQSDDLFVPMLSGIMIAKLWMRGSITVMLFVS